MNTDNTSNQGNTPGTGSSTNPANQGTGAGAGYGSTQHSGSGSMGSSGLNSSSNVSSASQVGAGTNQSTGANYNSGSSLGNSNMGSTSSYSTPQNSVDPDDKHHDYSATQKGGEIAGTPGAVVGRGIDAVQNTAGDAARAITGEDRTYGDNNQSGRYLTSTFRDRASAERAYESLSARGYTKDDVNLLMSDETRKTHFGDDTAHTELGSKAMEGAGVGSAIGGTAGAVIGAIAAIGTSVALPGLGLIIAGPLAAALAGAGAGGLTGGLVGALVGSGIPEERAAEYESDIKNGGIVMGVRPRNDEDARHFQDEFRRNSGDRIYY
ncbi:hypothetical protein [Hymenobacter gummosus]|uniref:hypothetical protein n=1 Tax=Hymenobacter gummosus TaxID=1776032 RepID=UPI002685C3DD